MHRPLASLEHVALPPASARQTTPRRRSPLRRWQEAGNFAVFVLPGLLIFIAVVLVPIVWTLGSSFTNARATRPETEFVWFDNFTFLLQNDQFLLALKNTAIITVIVVVGTQALGLGIALLLRQGGWLYNVLRSVFFTPVVLSAIVVSVIWRALLSDQGLINNSLRSWGIANPPGWLTDPNLAIYTVSGIMLWQMLGFAVVVYLASLAGVSKDIEEAASIDGAGPVRRFVNVTWPMIAPGVTITTVMMMISAFKTYDQIAVLTNGGPGVNGTGTVAFQLVDTAFTEQRFGLASAMAGIMLLIIGVLSVVSLFVLQRREVDF